MEQLRRRVLVSTKFLCTSNLQLVRLRVYKRRAPWVTVNSCADGKDRCDRGQAPSASENNTFNEKTGETELREIKEVKPEETRSFPLLFWSLLVGLQAQPFNACYERKTKR